MWPGSWPLIGPEWSRDLNTSLWLARLNKLGVATGAASCDWDVNLCLFILADWDGQVEGGRFHFRGLSPDSLCFHQSIITFTIWENKTGYDNSPFIIEDSNCIEHFLPWVWSCWSFRPSSTNIDSQFHFTPPSWWMIWRRMGMGLRITDSASLTFSEI